MSLLLTASLIALPLIVLLDLLWLGVLLKDFYRVRLGHLMAQEISWGAAVCFYVLFAVGLAYFAILPTFAHSVLRAFLVGALFGLITYGTYDLTNQATLRDWSPMVTVVDMLWGAFLSGTIVTLVHIILNRMQ